MNLAQKNAWFGLIGSLGSIPIIGSLGYISDNFWFLKFTAVLAVVFCLFFVAAHIIATRLQKKRTNEPEIDERDKQISKNANRICLLSLCLLIYFSDMAIAFYTGQDGSIPSNMLPWIHFGIGYIALTIYYASILILYRIKGGAA